jgi:hypothetical protein
MDSTNKSLFRQRAGQDAIKRLANCRGADQPVRHHGHQRSTSPMALRTSFRRLTGYVGNSVTACCRRRPKSGRHIPWSSETARPSPHRVRSDQEGHVPLGENAPGQESPAWRMAVCSPVFHCSLHHAAAKSLLSKKPCIGFLPISIRRRLRLVRPGWFLCIWTACHDRFGAWFR